MVADATSALSDLQRQYFAQQILGRSNEVAAQAAMIASTSYTATNITTSQLLKSGTCILKRILINSLGTVASTVKIYDGTSVAGTLLGTINSLALSGNFEYGVTCTGGIYVAITGVVPPDVTVIWK